MFSLVRWNVEWAVNNKESEQQPRMWAPTKKVINNKENEQQARKKVSNNKESEQQAR